MIRAGARIVNARGVPGTIACSARSLSDGAPMLLTAHHVLFGAGARAGDLIFDERGRPIGRTAYGRLGTVHFEGASDHIDCAVALLDDASDIEVNTLATVNVGDRVTKLGAASGLTSGVVIDLAFSEPAIIDGRAREASRQLLIRSTGATPFSTQGDSGAAIRNEHGAIVGILWGRSARGESVASHIAPVFHVLHLSA